MKQTDCSMRSIP